MFPVSRENRLGELDWSKLRFGGKRRIKLGQERTVQGNNPRRVNLNRSNRSSPSTSLGQIKRTRQLIRSYNAQVQIMHSQLKLKQPNNKKILSRFGLSISNRQISTMSRLAQSANAQLRLKGQSSNLGRKQLTQSCSKISQKQLNKLSHLRAKNTTSIWVKLLR